MSVLAPDALTAALGCLLVMGVEELRWTLSGRPSEMPVLIEASLVLAVLAGFLTAVVRRWRSRVFALGLPLTLVTALSGGRILSDKYEIISRPAAFVITLPLAVAAAWVIASIGRRRGGNAVLALVALLTFSPGLHALWLHARANPARPPTGVPNVILMVLDTTRQDHLSVYGYPSPTSPALEALAKDADVYTDAWSVAPWTPPSHASMLTGLLPAEHRVDGDAPPRFPRGLVTLPAVLRENGFSTAGFVANPQLAAPGWSREFDEYRATFYIGRHSLLHLLNVLSQEGQPTWFKNSASAVLGPARSWWSAHADRPRFLMLNLIEPHRPYAPPPRYFAQFLPGIERRSAMEVRQDPAPYLMNPGLADDKAQILRRLYDAEIRYMDDQIGSYIDWLRARGDLDKTLLIVTSDHGEHLGERGLVGHDILMDPCLLKVPLIVRYPPLSSGARISRRVQLDGLPGYVLSVLGLPAPEAMRSNSLERQQRTAVVAQLQSPVWYVPIFHKWQPSFDPQRYLGDWFFVANDRFAYQCSWENERSSLCRLDDLVADPEWTRDVSLEHPEVLEAFRALAKRLPSFREARHQSVDEALRERLNSLGYLP